MAMKLFMAVQNLVAWAAQHTSPYSSRKRYPIKTKELIGHYLAGTDYLVYSHMIASLLVTILNHTPEPYHICYFIMGALERI